MKSLSKIALVLPLSLGLLNQSISQLVAQPPATGTGKSPTWAVGESPRCAATGDFNGDGKADIVTANQNTNNLSVLLSTANGFQNANGSPIAVGAMPRSVALGDFNGDKKMDIAAGNSGAGTVSVLLGDGAGSFTAAPNSPVTVGGRPIALAVADMDANGQSDLAVVNNTAGQIAILLGNGKGGFTAAPRSPFAVNKTPFFAAFGDFNSDKVPDLAVANSGSNNVSLFIGLGDGTFGAKSDFAVGISPRALAVADFNNDKKLDLMVTGSGSNNVSFLPGDGTGSFGARKDFATGPGPRSVVAADFDGDGKTDVAIACDGSDSISLLLSDGAGNFTVPNSPMLKVGSHPVWAVAADVSGDTKADLVIVNSGSNDLSILLNNGAGGFRPLRANG